MPREHMAGHGPNKMVCPGCQRTVSVTADKPLVVRYERRPPPVWKLSRHSKSPEGGPICSYSRLAVDYKQPASV
jgi:hypothetical protein